MKKNLNRSQSSAAIDAREEFTNSTGSLHAVKSPAYVDRGRLNEVEYDRLLIDQHIVGLSYVVYSYSTPIAWERVDGYKYRVAQKFSVTTSQHMGLTWRGDNE